MSERALMDALPLDDVPALKVYLGLPQFGAREGPSGREDMLLRCRRARDKIGLFGFSAGGAAVLFALAEGNVPVDGLAHGWADSPHAAEVRRSIADWFNRT